MTRNVISTIFLSLISVFSWMIVTSASEAAATVLEESKYPIAKEADRKSNMEKADEVPVAESQNHSEKKTQVDIETEVDQGRSDVHAYSSSIMGGP